MKSKLSLITILLLLLNVSGFAQVTNPGNGDCGGGPDPCPLDTWVVVLVAGALLFTTIHLYRKQKAGEVERAA
jgi:hypothetical protein